MFATACKIASEFTRPVSVSSLMVSGKCGNALGAFVVINPEGWIVTAHHIIQLIDDLNDSVLKHQAWEAEYERIQNDAQMDGKAKRKALGKLGKPSQETVKRFAMGWGTGNIRLVASAKVPEVDLAIGRLEPFEPSWIKQYPVFKDPDKGFHQGTSLCCLGFPFHSVTPTYNQTTSTFEMPGPWPPPTFAIEGIISRTVTLTPPHPGPVPFRFVEMSSPGLKGQSGGPIFDGRGTVWAIQSQTRHYPLGFDPPVPDGRAGEREHQFLNAGWGIHSASLVAAFRELKVSFSLSEY